MQIFGNGSHWYGSPEDPIEKLYEVLAAHPLDPRTGGGPEGQFLFEPVYLDQSRQPPPGTFRAQGSVFTIAHGFCVEGTAEEMEPLRLLIEANVARPDYAEAYEMIITGPQYKRQLEYRNAPKLFPPQPSAAEGRGADNS